MLSIGSRHPAHVPFHHAVQYTDTVDPVAHCVRVWHAISNRTPYRSPSFSPTSSPHSSFLHISFCLHRRRLSSASPAQCRTIQVDLLPTNRHTLAVPNLRIQAVHSHRIPGTRLLPPRRVAINLLTPVARNRPHRTQAALNPPTTAHLATGLRSRATAPTTVHLRTPATTRRMATRPRLRLTRISRLSSSTRDLCNTTSTATLSKASAVSALWRQERLLDGRETR